VAEVDLAPVYQCLADNVFQAASAGEPGPDLNIAVTTLHTPYFADAALVRVEMGGVKKYYISSAPDSVINITDIGGNGPMGNQGQEGVRGENGRSASSDAPECTIGENGRDGQDGGPGHPGGDGGPGGRIKIWLDKAAADKLHGRIVAQSVGGAPGRGGEGGFGGQGGSGGSGVSGQGCSDVTGKPGRQGRQGPAGSEGRAGQAGPPPVVVTAARESLFADEMKIIQRIESAQLKTGHKKKKKKKKDAS